MSAESTAATVPQTRFSNDHSSPSLPSEAATILRESVHNDDYREPEAPPPPQASTPDLRPSVAMAVLEHWTSEQQTMANSSQPTGSTIPRTALQGANSFDDSQPLRQAQESWLRNTLSFLGIGRAATPARKSEMSLLWNLCWGLAQVAVISTLVALTGTQWKSRSNDSLTEWQACDRPLGPWACLWIARVILASGLAYWDFVRTRMARQLQPPANSPGSTTPAVPLVAQPAPHDAHAPSDPENPPPLPDSSPPPPVQLPWSHLYSRLTLLSSLLTLSWFLTAHVLQYTSLNTCRHTSPRLWWLIFGILCIMYVMVLEVLLLGFIVLVLAPILFVFWNIFLFCIGRHPAQNPHMIKPDIGKLPKSLVDRIPLVMYIPPPPSDTTKADSSSSLPSGDQHEYPPKSPVPPTPPVLKKSRFRLFKRKPPKENKDDTEGGAVQPNTPADVLEKDQETWEGSFEKGEYPFVILEGNRAACAICLMDFEEPRRRENRVDLPISNVLPNAGASTSSTPISSNVEDLKLTDAGEGAQPLRLLACGHVFHQTCLDPWLTDVSGRCPVCQRPVDARELKKRKRDR